MRCLISSAILQAIHNAAATAAPKEACGLLYGTPDAITASGVTPNVAQSPEKHFEIDPAALFAAIRAERRGEALIAGYWHSHPGGDAMPSPTDAAMAAPDEKLWLIVAGSDARLWRAVLNGGIHGRFDAITLEIPGA